MTKTLHTNDCVRQRAKFGARSKAGDVCSCGGLKPEAKPVSEKYPEHEKLRLDQPKVIALSDFYDFLGEQGWELATRDDKTERLHAIHKRPDEIIGLFLGIDPKKLEAEKVAMLAEIRSKQ